MLARWAGVGFLCSGVILAAGWCSAGQQSPPLPASVPPNASLVTATVLKYSIWNSKLLQPQMEIEPGLTVYSLTVDVLDSQKVSAQLENLVKPNDQLEAFSREALSPELFGKKIQATMELVGDIRQAHFWISKIQVSPSK